MERVVIYGAGQLGVMAAYILADRKDVEVVGFIDDDPLHAGYSYEGARVIGDRSRLPGLKEEGVRKAIVCIGDNRARARIARGLEDIGFELVNAVHPTANVSQKARFGRGSIVAQGVVICANSVLGSNLYIGPGAVISHDVSVGDHALLSVGCTVAARVDIGAGAFIGAGATVVPAQMGNNRLRVGEYAVVGAGAVVLGDVPANAVVVGVPARVVRYLDAEGR